MKWNCSRTWITKFTLNDLFMLICLLCFMLKCTGNSRHFLVKSHFNKQTQVSLNEEIIHLFCLRVKNVANLFSASLRDSGNCFPHEATIQLLLCRKKWCKWNTTCWLWLTCNDGKCVRNSQYICSKCLMAGFCFLGAWEIFSRSNGCFISPSLLLKWPVLCASLLNASS